MPIIFRGELLRRTRLQTAGSYNFQILSETRTIVIKCLGGGGGGGGCAAASAGTGNVAGGGASGCYSESVVDVGTIPTQVNSVTTTLGVTVGAAGTAGANTGGTGGSGGLSNVSDVVGNLCVAEGGLGGVGASADPAAETFTLGGSSGVLYGTSDIESPGEPGMNGHVLALGAAGCSGMGGSSQFGSGARGRITTGAGTAGSSFGAGGSGALALSGGGANAGGAGTAGLVIIEEYA